MAEELRFLSKIPMSVKEEVGEITELNIQVTLLTVVLQGKSPVLLILGLHMMYILLVGQYRHSISQSRIFRTCKRII